MKGGAFDKYELVSTCVSLRLAQDWLKTRQTYRNRGKVQSRNDVWIVVRRCHCNVSNIEAVASVEVTLLRVAGQIADSVAHIFAVAAWRAVEGSTGRPVGDSADGLYRAMRHTCWSRRRCRASIRGQACFATVVTSQRHKTRSPLQRRIRRCLARRMS